MTQLLVSTEQLQELKNLVNGELASIGRSAKQIQRWTAKMECRYDALLDLQIRLGE